MSILLVHCRRRKTRILYYIFGIMGGFYRPDIASPWARYAWGTINAISVLYASIVGFWGYLLTTKEIRPSDLFYTIAITVGVFYTTVFIPLVTYYYHDQLTSVIRHMDDEFGCHEPEARKTDMERRKFDGISEAISWLIVMTTLEVVFASSNIAYLFALCDKSCLSNPLFYVEATPFIEYIRSMKVYVTIFAVQTFLIILAATHANCIMAFGLMSGYELHNVFANLSIQLEHLIDDTASVVNAPARGQMASRNRESLEKRDSVDSDEYRKFKEKLAVIVKHYQTLKCAIEKLRPWIHLMSSINLLSIFFVQTPFAYITLVSEGELLIKIKGVIGFITVTLVIYGNCLLGKIFENTNEIMIKEVYSVTWYDLPPVYRKMFHILFSQIQQPIHFFAIQVYPVNMVTFARSVNFVYTVINLLRHRNTRF